MREGSAPNFAPPAEEGMVLTLEDEKGDLTHFEFLGIIIHEDHRYGCFLPVPEGQEQGTGESGEVVILEVTEFDDEGWPIGFELPLDEDLLEEVYRDFAFATKDLYDFE
ncbi:MAG: DUF1292 domain-containing protein [Coriobacteriia bacterium]|nr:DUF1292 domain-containing protein [Coriobacteriia bacterium]